MGKKGPAQAGKKGDAQPSVAIAPVESISTPASLPILEKLKSENSGDREFACAGIARAIEEEGALAMLLSANALPLIVARLADTDLAVRVAAAGALRNITVVGGEDLCAQIIQQTDCLTPLLATMREVHAVAIGTQVAPATEVRTSEELRQQSQSLLEEAIELLLNLCESSEKATDTVTQSGLVPALFQLLPSTCEPSLVTAAAKFLNVLLDNNDALRKQLLVAEPALLTGVGALVDKPGATPYFRLLLGGLLLALRPRNVKIVSRLLPLLRSAFTLDTNTYLLSLLPDLNIVPTPVPGESASLPPALVKQLVAWQQSAAAQQLALEQLAGLFTVGTDDDGADASVATRREQLDATGRLLASAPDLVTKIVARCVPVPAELSNLARRFAFLEDPGQRLNIRGDTPLVIQCRALACFNNALLSMPPVPAVFGDLAAHSRLLWDTTYVCSERCFVLAAERQQQQIASPSTAETDLVEVLELATATLWTLLRLEAIVLDVNVMLRRLIDLARFPLSGAVRAAAWALLTAVLQLPACQPAHFAEAGPLFPLGLADAAPEALAEALNSVFDLFAEPLHDTLFEKLHLKSILVSLASTLPARLKRERKQMEIGAWERLDEASDNLSRFLKYKAIKL